MDSMDEIYRKYASRVYQYLISLTRDPDIAEELTQETFYQAIRCIDRYDGSCKVTTWLCAIAKRQLLSYQRKHPPAEPLVQENEEGDSYEIADSHMQTPSAEQECLSKIEKARLLKQIHRLKEPYREVLYLRIYGGLSFKEIGDIFDKTENWARTTFYRSKDQLRKEIDE